MINNDRIPAKFRYLAAFHHLIFAIVTFPIVIIIPLSKIIFHTAITDSFAGILIISILLCFGMPIFSWLLWVLTGRIHPFIDLAGRDVRNYTINHSLVCLLIIFITITTCGMTTSNYYSDLKSSQGLSTATKNILTGGTIVLYCNEAGYFMNSVTSVVFSIRGYRFKNRLLIPFIKDN
jgi:uncharacterized Tic20 family protein